jgi:hypothetical protein
MPSRGILHTSQSTEHQIQETLVKMSLEIVLHLSRRQPSFICVSQVASGYSNCSYIPRSHAVLSAESAFDYGAYD